MESKFILNQIIHDICLSCNECVFCETEFETPQYICFLTQNDKCECDLIQELKTCPKSKW